MTPTDRLAFASAGAVRKFSLPTLQDAVGFRGHVLTAPDLEYANELLGRGYSRAQVKSLAIGWANEYARVSYCEGREAERFSSDAYGY